MTIDKFIS